MTGGGRGIGAAVAETLARRGANVTVMGRTLTTLERVAGDLRQHHGVSAIAVACDVSDEKAVDDAFARAVEEQGDAYVLVNNAGRGESARFTAMDTALWNRTIAVNRRCGS